MPQRRIHIRVDFTAHLLPPAAKRVVFRKVPARNRVYHAVKNCAIRIKVPILMIIDTVEFWVIVAHFLDNFAFDKHKTCRTVKDLDKSIIDWPRHRTYIYNE